MQVRPLFLFNLHFIRAALTAHFHNLKILRVHPDAPNKISFAVLYFFRFQLKLIGIEIVHVLLTHSPQAPRFPSTLEGKILYYVDQMDVIAIYKDRWHKELFITK